MHTRRLLSRFGSSRVLGALVVVAMSLGACGSDSTTDSGDAGIADAGSDVTVQGDAPSSDSPPPPCSGPGANPDAWATYGHDARRTSASNGCIHASLTEAWRYGGNGGDASTFVPGIYNAIADRDALYVHVAFSAPTVDRVAATDGTRAWRFKGSADYDTGNWLTLGLGYVLADDDGVYLINIADGTLKTTSGVDWWGQTAVDEQRFYVVTATHGDGPGAFVGAWEVAKGLTWKANVQGGCMPPVGDENGALAVDKGVVFYAPRYEIGNASFGVGDGGTFAVPSGLYAFDAATGTSKWSVPTIPRSSISIGDGHVYLVEDGPALVARSVVDGATIWKAPLTVGAQTIGAQPPLVALGRVVIGTSDHVLAFDAATGKAAWSMPLVRAAIHGNDSATINFVSCPSAGEPNASPVTTTFAASTASNTLIVTAADAIHVLAIDSGVELGTHPLAQATNPVIVGDRLYVVASSTVGTQIVALKSR